jgi:alkylhydroperoxidase family enzyme
MSGTSPPREIKFFSGTFRYIFCTEGYTGRLTGESMQVDERLRALRDHVAEAPGQLSPVVRVAALSGAAVPAAAQAYTDKVRRHAYKVTDRDVEDLRAAQWSEDQIFELTVAAALGAGVSRLDHARRALREAGPA